MKFTLLKHVPWTIIFSTDRAQFCCVFHCFLHQSVPGINLLSISLSLVTSCWCLKTNDRDCRISYINHFQFVMHKKDQKSVIGALVFKYSRPVKSSVKLKRPIKSRFIFSTWLVCLKECDAPEYLCEDCIPLFYWCIPTNTGTAVNLDSEQIKIQSTFTFKYCCIKNRLHPFLVSY